jgi:AcrR family transcriptional regulator
VALMPPGKAKTNRKPASDRKAEILQTALGLAFEVGPDMVTTSMIAGRLGLSQPSIYKHFSSKDDIWAQISQQLTTRVRQNLDCCCAAQIPPDDHIRMQVMDHLHLLQDAPALPEIMALRDLHNTQNPLRNKIAQTMTGFYALLVEHVKAAQERGIFRCDIDANDAATLILGIIQSLVFRMILSRNTSILVPEGARLLELQLSGFTPDQVRE